MQASVLSGEKALSGKKNSICKASGGKGRPTMSEGQREAPKRGSSALRQKQGCCNPE